MKNEDFKKLEEVYESINNKEKELISEDANEGLGAALVYVVAFGLPFVFDYFSRKYPELKEKFNQIKIDLKNNKQTQMEVKEILSKNKPQQQSQPDQLGSMLTGGVRKKQPRI